MCIITEKDLLAGLSGFLHPNKKQILQLNNHLMARMFWFYKEAMDLDVESKSTWLTYIHTYIHEYM